MDRHQFILKEIGNEQVSTLVIHNNCGMAVPQYHVLLEWRIDPGNCQILEESILPTRSMFTGGMGMLNKICGWTCLAAEMF